MQCEMCGKEGELKRVVVEGSELLLCDGCSRYGKVLGKARPIVKKKVFVPVKQEIEHDLVGNYSKLIRDARNKLGMKQEEFAKLLNERESIVSKMESGSFKPRIFVAKKIEKILKIKLIEEVKKNKLDLGKNFKSNKLTIGDIKIKYRGKK